jgi:hypothetical protein
MLLLVLKLQDPKIYQSKSCNWTAYTNVDRVLTRNKACISVLPPLHSLDTAVLRLVSLKINAINCLSVVFNAAYE